MLGVWGGLWRGRGWREGASGEDADGRGREKSEWSAGLGEGGVAGKVENV